MYQAHKAALLAAALSISFCARSEPVDANTINRIATKATTAARSSVSPPT